MPTEPVDPLQTLDQPQSAETNEGWSAAGPSGATTDLLGKSSPSSRSNAAKTPTVPGYEVLDELGRGGMGVVYLARQTSLKRMVALKMIRGGGDASPEQLERFRVEGEAVARLQHPNIVQIFEIGEHDGDPYFALEYVAGGSLAGALAAGPWSPADAAETVETLARAIHHAHLKNVVHRDLKPANVLLSADRVPKVTDFGLAKRLEEGDSGQTRTGAVMGTPSYMAPEQAAGRTRQIGPATDVYALGAILYECLTGRVVFKGDSVLDTLDMVSNAEPVAPSKLRPGVPRDLETICLKALAKLPQARYPSALGLAQDLERYRSGEPILGRRAGVARKLARRALRNKAAVTAALAVVAVAVTVAVAALSARSSRGLRDAEERVALALERPTWDAAAAEEAEADVDRLAALDPEGGSAARRRLTERFAAAVRAELRGARVSPADVPGLEARLAWLAPRDAEVARVLDAELRARLRAWQTVAEVAAPFANAAAAFAPGAVRLEAGQLVVVGPGVATRLPAQGTLKVTADFAGDWYRGGPLGLTFGARAGYAFVLRPAWPRGDPDAPARAGPPPSFEAGGGAATLEILRDGVPLGGADVCVQAGALRLAAERDGDRLAVQLNGAAAVPFEDPVPLPLDATATVAVTCPAGTALRRLAVEGQALPTAASRLERADDLLGRGNPLDALPLYEGFVQESADPAARDEARCKAGLCLVRLGRGPDAAGHFEEVVAGASPRWGVIAAFQLWAVRLKAKQFEEADAALTVIKLRFPKEAIARYVPVSLRGEIDLEFAVPAIGWLIFDPKLIPRLESALRVADVLQLDAGRFGRDSTTLVKAYGMAGDYRAARAVADRGFPASLELGHVPGGHEQVHWNARLHAWAGRLTGQTSDYGEPIARHLGGPPRDGENPDDRKRAFVPLRLESARNLAARGDWPVAEREIDAYLAEYPTPVLNYAFHATPRHLKGFARLKAGDPTGAAAAWAGGTYTAYQAGLPPELRSPDALRTGRLALVESWAMAAHSGTLTDAEADATVQGLASSFGSEEFANQISAWMKVTPALMRGVWTSPRGKEWARRMAYLDLTPVEYYWTPPRLLVYEKLRHDLHDGLATPEQDEALWLATVKVCDAFRTGEMTKPQVFQLALTWRGTTNVLGWGGIAPRLKPETRGPAAYLFGLRLRKLGKAAESAAMFKTAAADAPAGSPLKKLAEAELAAAK